MATFITRVELHKANSEDYETLHSEMIKLKFFQVIQDFPTKQWHHLPTAEYHSTGNLKVGDVCLLARKAAEKTKKEFSVLVTEAKSITWFNLPLAKKH